MSQELNLIQTNEFKVKLKINLTSIKKCCLKITTQISYKICCNLWYALFKKWQSYNSNGTIRESHDHWTPEALIGRSEVTSGIIKYATLAFRLCQNSNYVFNNIFDISLHKLYINIKDDLKSYIAKTTQSDIIMRLQRYKWNQTGSV